MHVQEINPNNREEFFKLQKLSNEVYSSEEWVNAYPESIKCFGIFKDSQQLVGGFVAYEAEKKGIKMLITPPFASHVGWFFNSAKSAQAKLNSERKDSIQAIADFLQNSNYKYFKLEFGKDAEDMQPFIWKKFKVEVKYTYVVDLLQSEADLLAHLDPKLRNKLNKDSKEFSWDESKNPDASFRLFSETLKRSGVHFNAEVLKALLKSPILHPIYAKQNDTEIAMACFAGQGNRCYYLFGSIDRNNTDNSLGPKSIWNAMISAKKMGFELFDMEGSMVPEIESYFRQFGGKLENLYTIKGGRGLWPRLIQWYLNK
ncbi:MAG: hypothetical protein R2809_12380 [Flavobacteriales bacterium]